MINDNLKLSGALSIVLTDKDGNVGTAKAVVSHMALGAGTSAAAASQTDLVSILGSREPLDSTTITGTNLEKVQYVATFEPGDATGAVTEAGLFNAASAGDMLCRTVFPVVNKAADDQMAITWTITLSAI
jgi:hypothetical protein